MSEREDPHEDIVLSARRYSKLSKKKMDPVYLVLVIELVRALLKLSSSQSASS